MKGQVSRDRLGLFATHLGGMEGVLRAEPSEDGGSVVVSFDLGVDIERTLETARASFVEVEVELWSEESFEEGDTHQAHLGGVLVYSEELTEEQAQENREISVLVYRGGYVQALGPFREDVELGGLMRGKDWEIRRVPLREVGRS